jgi:hypothetical protein
MAVCRTILLKENDPANLFLGKEIEESRGRILPGKTNKKKLTHL